MLENSPKEMTEFSLNMHLNLICCGEEIYIKVFCIYSPH